MLVLVVEDEISSREMLVDVVSSRGYEVLQAENGTDALDILGNHSVDIVISDILMPEMDGYDLCRIVKQDEVLKNIFFAFYTATYIEEQDKILAFSVGANEFYVKPMDPFELLGDIENKYLRFLQNKAEGNELIQNEINSWQQELMHSKVVSKKLVKKIRELDSEKEKAEYKKLQLRQITDALPELISELDSELNYQYVNKTYEKWHNKSRDDILGKNIRELIGDEVFFKIEKYLRRALDGEEVSYKTELTYSTGETKYIWARYIPRIDRGGKVIGFVALVTDITEQKKNEEEKLLLQNQLRQAQKMEAIGQLTGGIAHDFNNILAGINGFTEVALSAIENDYENNRDIIKDYLQEVAEAGFRANELVSKMLAFCRGSPGNKSTTNLNPIVEEVVNLLRPSIPSSIEINLRLDSKPALATVDPGMIHQVLMNLCLNAKDSINIHGFVSLEVKSHAELDTFCSSCSNAVSGEYVTITVTDTGEGISEENLDRVFEPFYSTKETLKGTGMGLAMVHGIVHELGGHVFVSSAPSVGTTFTIALPQAKEGQGQEQKPEKKTKLVASGAVHGPATIMVVDDEEAIRNLLDAWLTKNKYQVYTFNNGYDALTEFCANKNKYDLLITDQTMPSLTGTELIKSIKVIDKNFPTILCTGNKTAISKDVLAKLDTPFLLTKPYSMDKLLEVINSAITSGCVETV